MHPILLRLAIGSPGVTGEAAAVADEIAGDPDLFAVVVDGLESEHAGVRNRAANALDRATRRRPDLLDPHAGALLAAAEAHRPGTTLRRLLPLLLGRLDVSPSDARRIAAYARSRLGAGVPVATRVNALDALGSMAEAHAALRPGVRPLLDAALDAPEASMRARARRVLHRLDRASR